MPLTGRRQRPTLVILAALVVVAALGVSSAAALAGSASTSGARDRQVFTPVVGSVPNPPVAFAGSDGRTHLAYELSLTSAARVPTTIDRVQIVDATSDAVVETLGQEDVARALTLVSLKPLNGTLDATQSGTLRSPCPTRRSSPA